jgi:hypothetical protein
MGADRREPVLQREAPVARQRVEAASPARGPSTIATATARLSVTTGLGASACSRS